MPKRNSAAPCIMMPEMSINWEENIADNASKRGNVQNKSQFVRPIYFVLPDIYSFVLKLGHKKSRGFEETAALHFNESLY